MRLLKQLFYGTTFLLVVFGILFGAWYYFSDQPDCFDGIRNGEEEGVDCGLLACGIPCPPPLKDLEVSEFKIFKISDGEYDFIAKVFNPNNSYGAREVYYDLILEDRLGDEIFRENRNFYILPGQIKYVVVPSIRETGEASIGKIEITQINWFSYDPLGSVKFPLRSQERIGTPTTSQFNGVVINDSDFDFDNVEVRVIVQDITGKVVAVHTAPIKTLLSRTERHFVVTWPFVIPNFENTRVDVEVDTNLFVNSNFLRVHSDNNQPFQQFY